MLKWERWPEGYKGGVNFLNIEEAKEWNHKMDKRGMVHLWSLREEHTRIQARNRALEDENLRLKAEIERLKSDPRYIERVARGRLGLVKEDEMIIEVVDGGAGPEGGK